MRTSSFSTPKTAEAVVGLASASQSHALFLPLVPEVSEVPEPITASVVVVSRPHMVTPMHAVVDAHLAVSQLRKVLDEVVMSTPAEGKLFTL